MILCTSVILFLMLSFSFIISLISVFFFSLVGIACQFFLFSKPTLGLVNLIYCFSVLYFSNFCFMPIISFLLLVWGSVFSFSSSLVYRVVLLGIFLASECRCIAMNFPLRTILVASHEFQYIVFIFLCLKKHIFL